MKALCLVKQFQIKGEKETESDGIEEGEDDEDDEEREENLLGKDEQL